MKGRCSSVADDRGRTVREKSCGTCRESRASALKDEGGYVLLEFLTSFPVYIVLLVSLFAVWLFFLKSYVVLLGDWELQQEMRLTLERIAQDASMATHIECSAPYELHIERHVNGKKSTTDYVLREGRKGQPPYISKKVSGEDHGYYAPQPMTGGSNVFGNLAVVDFQCKPDKGLLHLSLTGENRRTKKRVTFSTTVCLPPKEKDKKEAQGGKT